MKILRYLLFFVICLILFRIIFYLITLGVYKLQTLSWIWIIVLPIFAFGLVLGLFQSLSAGLTLLVSKISPNGNFSIISAGLILVGLAIFTSYSIWTNDIDYSFRVILATILGNIIIVQVGFVLFMTVAEEANEREEGY